MTRTSCGDSSTASRIFTMIPTFTPSLRTGIRMERKGEGDMLSGSTIDGGAGAQRVIEANHAVDHRERQHAEQIQIVRHRQKPDERREGDAGPESDLRGGVLRKAKRRPHADV